MTTPAKDADKPARAGRAGRAGTAQRVALGALALLVAALPLLPVPEFWITQLNYIGLYSLVALGLVLLTGIGGLTSFGQAAFVGIGAYATGYVTSQLGWSAWIGLPLGLVLTAATALLLGLLTLRMSGHYLPLATIAWCLALYYLIWTAAVGGAVAVLFLLDSRPGRIMRALNAHTGAGTTMPEAMGASTFRHKVTMFLIAALLASLSGWLFAHMQRNVNPSPFGIKWGIEYLFMAVLGGVGSVWGAFVGAGVVKVVEDQLQVHLPRLIGTSGNYEVIVFGIVLVVVLKVAPRGLWPAIARLFPSPPRRRDWGDAQPLPQRSKPAPGELLLDVKDARKAFGGLVAVNDVSFAIRAGEIVGLIGPNGAGKSTIFNLISGVAPLTAGSVSFKGRRIDGLPSRAVARLGMSRTFQHVKLVPEMTVLENVAIGCYVRGRAGSLRAMLRLDRAEERQALHEAERQLRRIGLEAHLHEPAGNLALGPQRLVEIARALASDPSLLLLDEPAAGLRHKEKAALAAVLRQLREEGLSLLLVEHDMEFVMNLTDRIVVMEFGTKLIEDTPAEVQKSPAVRAAYLGVEH